MNKSKSFLSRLRLELFRYFGGFFNIISGRERILFFKQLATLLKAGISLTSSLYILRDQNGSKTLKRILMSVIHDVENGQYLATAFGKFRKTFGELSLNIVSVGEISGSLSDNLERLVIVLRKQQALRQKIISASVYPLFIIVATFGITFTLVVFFFPKIIPVLKSVNYSLPITTRFLIFASDFLKESWLILLISFTILIIVVYFFLKIKKIRYLFDNFVLSLPFIGKIIKFYNLSNLFRTLGLLENSGVNVVKSFKITSTTTSNLVYKRNLELISDDISKGEKISNQLEKSPKLFTQLSCQIIRVGEGTGKLSESFLYASDMYGEELDEITKNLSVIIEPLLLLFMGILVGFIAVSIITPIYGITQNINSR